MTNYDLPQPPQQVLDSLHAGRITPDQANLLHSCLEIHTLDSVLEFLYRLERSNTTGNFFQEELEGFILRGFRYRRTWSEAKKRQAIAALTWALEIITADLEGGDLK